MNLLLIGFSEQNATAIRMLCKRDFQSIQSFFISRQFSTQMNLILPRRDQILVAADAFIIDLEGVGMTRYSREAQADLLEFIDNKPTILASRRDLSDWKILEQHSNASVFYLSVPYSINDMNDVLRTIQSDKIMSDRALDKQESVSSASGVSSKDVDSLFAASNFLQSSSTSSDSKNQSATSRLDERLDSNISQISPDDKATINTTSLIRQELSVNDKSTLIDSHDDEKRLSSINSNKDHAIGKNQPNINILDSVLQQYFAAVYDTILVQSVLSVFAQKQPVVLQVDKYELLIDPVERSVLMDTDITRVVDYFCIVGTHKYALSSTDRVKVMPISNERYMQKSQQLSISGHKKYALSTIFWQLAAEVDFKDIPNVVNTLQLKIKYIPNFAMMRFVPSYIYPVLAACLNKVRTVTELQTLFPELSLRQLNHIILLCILSGVVDEGTLVADPMQVATSQQQIVDEKYINTDIRQANRTGFFKRLLQKLSI